MNFRKFLFLVLSVFLGMQIFYSCEEKNNDPRFSEGVLNLELFEDIDTTMQVTTNPVKPEDRVLTYDTTAKRFAFSATDILDTYISIGFSLYYDDPLRAMGAAKLMLSYVGMTENLYQNDDSFTEGVSEKKVEDWESYRDKLYVLGMRIYNNKTDIVKQRNDFSILTDVMIDFINEYGINGPAGVNMFYCQKALDGKGGYWLNRTQNNYYMNPYFAMVTDSTQKFDSCMVLIKEYKFD